MNKRKLEKCISMILISVFLITSLTGCIKKDEYNSQKEEFEVLAEEQSETISTANNDEEIDSEDSIHEIPYEILSLKGELKDNDDVVVDCNVKYLQLKNIYNRPYIDSLNEEIRKRAEYKYNDNMNGRGTGYASKYEATIEVEYAKNGVLSFLETSNYYSEDAAIEEVEGYTYSLKDEKQMELSDILVDAEVEKRNIIENACLEIEQISTEVSDEDLNKIGFYLNEDELVFLIPVFTLNRPKGDGNTKIYAPSYEENHEIYKNFGQYNI